MIWTKEIIQIILILAVSGVMLLAIFLGFWMGRHTFLQPEGKAKKFDPGSKDPPDVDPYEQAMKDVELPRRVQTMKGEE